MALPAHIDLEIRHARAAHRPGGGRRGRDPGRRRVLRRAAGPRAAAGRAAVGELWYRKGQEKCTRLDRRRLRRSAAGSRHRSWRRSPSAPKTSSVERAEARPAARRGAAGAGRVGHRLRTRAPRPDEVDVQAAGVGPRSRRVGEADPRHGEGLTHDHGPDALALVGGQHRSRSPANEQRRRYCDAR